MGLLTWGLGALAVAAEPAALGTLRDRSFLYALQGLLKATGEWDEVLTTGLPEQTGATSYDTKLCSLELAGFLEQDQRDDYGATPAVRIVQFTLWILVRNQSPDLRDDECDRLAQVAANAINGQSFGGLAFYDMSRLKGGKYLPATGPERRLACAGQFAYEVSDFSAHDATP